MEQDAPARSTAGLVARVGALAVLVLLLGSGLGLLIGQSASSGSAASGGTLTTDPDRSVVLLTGGTLQVGEETLTGLQAEGRTVNDEGAGFLVGSPPLGRRVLDFLPDPDLDLLVVQGGEVDAKRPVVAGAVEVGALHLVDRVRAGSGPRTAIVLVGPVPEDATPDGRLLQVRDQLRTAAQARGVPFLDPVVLGWRTGQADLSEQLVEALLPLVPQGS